MSGQSTPAERLAGKVDLLADAMVGYQVAVDTLAESYDTLNTREREALALEVENKRKIGLKAINAVADAYDDSFDSLNVLDNKVKEATTAQEDFAESSAKVSEEFGDSAENVTKAYMLMGANADMFIKATTSSVRALQAKAEAIREGGNDLDNLANATQDYLVAEKELEPVLMAMAAIFFR